MIKQKTSLTNILFFIISVAVLWCSASCSPADKYHSKRHDDTMKKDIDAAHRDIDRVLGLDEPSPLIEEK
ncbi:MAG: hypothetical protein UZ01_01725 [Candidatus Brocadia sinica]|nr:MAG: hypothetical protein UZ01_01725 [Candidatus Brocadia sinica]MCK6467548.1 hypothetical protein [Candidatus Brocadia sinica]NUO05137.1 hypothetical protein [Candidatus Brocadia sinica]